MKTKIEEIASTKKINKTIRVTFFTLYIYENNYPYIIIYICLPTNRTRI